jgi:hypothetical protein
LDGNPEKTRGVTRSKLLNKESAVALAKVDDAVKGLDGNPERIRGVTRSKLIRTR